MPTLDELKQQLANRGAQQSANTVQPMPAQAQQPIQQPMEQPQVQQPIQPQPQPQVQVQTPLGNLDALLDEAINMDPTGTFKKLNPGMYGGVISNIEIGQSAKGHRMITITHKMSVYNNTNLGQIIDLKTYHMLEGSEFPIKLTLALIAKMYACLGMDLKQMGVEAGIQNLQNYIINKPTTCEVGTDGFSNIKAFNNMLIG